MKKSIWARLDREIYVYDNSQKTTGNLEEVLYTRRNKYKITEPIVLKSKDYYLWSSKIQGAYLSFQTNEL